LGGVILLLSRGLKNEPNDITLKSRIHVDHPMASALLANQLHLRLQKQNLHTDPLIVMCIGTDRSTGDALGPLVGSYIERSNIDSLIVYGTLDTPVHAANLPEILSIVEKSYPNNTVIAVDACLGKSEHIGSMSVRPGPLLPGRGVNKYLPSVGQLHIVGIVNVGGFMEYFVLQNTRLNLVVKMAETISESIKICRNISMTKNSSIYIGIGKD
jgi:putative sporulation protein YyaC